MADEFRDELISISEKMTKYNSSMQQSLNMLSDEFELLRDELSTLNKSLEKTSSLDENLKDFKNTVEILNNLQDKLQNLQKITESISALESISAQIETLKQGSESSSAIIKESLAPLNQKIDALFGKMDAALSTEREVEKDSEIQLKEGEELRGLANTIQEELKRMQQSFSDQNNAIRSIGTSVAFLSSSEGELSKRFDGFLKTYQQDRTKTDEGKTGEKTEEKISSKLGEIISMLKEQTKTLEKSAKGEENAKIEELRKSLAEQIKMLAIIKDSMPSGNFEEVIKHSDLINQATNSKLDAIAEENTATSKSVSTFNQRLEQLPSLMKNISAALDTLVEEMKKAQVAYGKLQSSIQNTAPKTGDLTTEHIQRLDVIKENIKGLHSKIEAPHPSEETLKAVLEELKKFNQKAKDKMEEALPEKAQKSDLETKIDAVLEKLKKLETLKTSPAAEAAPASDPFAGLEELKTKVDAINEALKKIQQMEEKRATASTIVADRTSGEGRDVQFIAIKKELGNVNENMKSLKSMLSQGVDITAEVDFKPILAKIEELEAQIGKGAPVHGATIERGAALRTEQLMDQRELLEEIRQNLRVFETFELSDRAKIVVERLNMLVKRCLASYTI